MHCQDNTANFVNSAVLGLHPGRMIGDCIQEKYSLPMVKSSFECFQKDSMYSNYSL